MANVEEDLNLGDIDRSLDVAIRNQFEKLYNELETRWRQQATEINVKPDLVINTSTAATRSPPGTSLTQYRTGTIYIDQVPLTPTVWHLVEKTGSPPQATWVQLG